ncbi:MAG: translation initiation factor IF-2 associated domain-containing protein, partial [Rhodospirillaceae bacterium]
MAETTENDKDKAGKLGLSGGKLTLNKTVEKRQTRQNFSHGRSKMVTVEVKKRRTITPGGDDAKADRGAVLGEAVGGLSEEEREARQKILEQAKQARDTDLGPQLPKRPMPVEPPRAEPEAVEPEAPAVAPAAEPRAGEARP